MLYAKVIAAISIIASTSAAPLATSPPLQISNLLIEKVVGGNVTIGWTVYDPDPLTLETTECGGTWKTGSKGFPKDTYVCQHSSIVDAGVWN